MRTTLASIELTLPDLFRLRAATAAVSPSAKHRGNSCVFLFLFGGPSHIDLWDMKPKAPAEIRGEFTPVATAVPGIDFCEHLPRLAKVADKLCQNDHVHISCKPEAAQFYANMIFSAVGLPTR